jgi:hypothetical protein
MSASSCTSCSIISSSHGSLQHILGLAPGLDHLHKLVVAAEQKGPAAITQLQRGDGGF